MTIKKKYTNLNRLIDVQEILQELERNGLFDLRGYRVIDREETQQKNAKEKRKEHEI
ncbi:hypothetical protein [Enterococcus faecium]|uniref:hypothetical protein n=1 Tax=Enterococcus faecium TaxID=1352 RepID=UPI00338FD002